MARVASSSASTVVPLDTGWSFCRSAPGEFDSPAAFDKSALTRLPAPVPGTVAQALEAAGQFDAARPEPLDNFDFWYRVDVGRGAALAGPVLCCDGLATLADVWVDGQHVLRSESMFLEHRVPLPKLNANSVLHIRFGALQPFLAGKKGRARWRGTAVREQKLRFARTTLLGRMIGWGPEVHAVGPYRPVRLESHALEVLESSVQTSFDAHASVRARIVLGGSVTDARLRIGPWEAKLTRAPGSSAFELDARVEGVEPWWPHTHGSPHVYPVTVLAGGQTLSLGSTGFRSLRVNTSGGAFELFVNGVRVFCRGACWTGSNIVTHASSAAVLRPLLELARDAGFNMLRVPAQATYESNDFYALCSELGLLVWQDALVASFDYPWSDAAFTQVVQNEVQGFLSRTQLEPSLALLCGGSETQQQPAMLGLDRALWNDVAVDAWLPAMKDRLRPDVPYVSNTPSGGALPFVSQAGPSHYYGIPAFRRPMDDARRAEVRFASECLGFSLLPEHETLTQALGPGANALSPEWRSRAARNANTTFDFVDVRDHYLKLLYGADPMALRVEDPQRYLLLSKAVPGEVMHDVLAEWRRARSTCAGALVWFYRDLWPSEGWGVIDSYDRPKTAWHALRRACQPRAVFLTDENVNGLAVHVHNESAEPFDAKLELVLLREGRVPIAKAERALKVEPRAALELSAHDVLGSFLDVSYAFRFGPPSHDVTIATLFDAKGVVLSEAFHFPIGRASRARDTAVHVATACAPLGDGRFQLKLEADAFVQSVFIEDPSFRASDAGFHLVPGRAKNVVLTPRAGATGAPSGDVYAINLSHPVRIK